MSAAVRLYTELASSTNTDDRTQVFVQDRLAALELEQKLQTGEWVDFLPTAEGLPGWYVERGRCKILPDGALEVQSDEGGHLVCSRARIGADFEARGTFEVVRSSTTSFQAGLVMGSPQFESSGWYGFRIKRNVDEGDIASFSPGWSTPLAKQGVALNSITNSFSFHFQNGLVNASVNGRQILKDVKRPEYPRVPTTDSLLGLGAFNDLNDTVIRYRNVQVRKLSPGTSP